MLEQLRGRNLAHVGCTLGLTAGLVLGLVIALAAIAVAGADASLAALVWLGITFGLGALGYFLGGRSPRRSSEDLPLK
jgi:hypothetical protein